MNLGEKMERVLAAVLEIEAAPTEAEAVLTAIARLEQLQYPHVMVAFLREVDGRRCVVADPNFATGSKWQQIAQHTVRDFDNPVDVLPLVLQHRQARFVLDTRTDPESDQQLCSRLGIVSQYAMPLATGSRLIGTLQVDMGTLKSEPTRELQMLDALAAHLSIAIDRIRVLAEFEQLNSAILQHSKLQAFDAAAAKIMHELMHSIGDYNKHLAAALHNPALRHNKQAVDFLAFTKRRVADWIERVSNNVASARKSEETSPHLVADIIKDAVDIWNRKAGVRNCKVRGQYQTPNACVLARRGAFLEVLSCLIINSIEANATEVVVEVSTAPANSGASVEVLISVNDDGDGIPPALQNQIGHFGWTSKGSQGRGMGLTIVELLCNQMGGNGRFVSYGKGAQQNRTVFEIRIPFFRHH